MSKKKIKSLKNLFSFIAYVLLFLPLGIWVALNADKYFVHKSGMSVGMGAIMAVLFIILLLKYGFKKFNKVFWISFLLAIVACLNTIVEDLLPITFFAWIGVILFSIFEIPINYYRKKYNTYEDEETRTYVRNNNINGNGYNGNGRC